MLTKHCRILVFLFLLPFWLKGQLYTFRNYNHKDGLSIATVSSIHPSNDGSIWLGTDGAGLIRFNGTVFEELEIDNMRHHVSSISEYSNKLFFTSKYEGVFEYQNSKYKHLIKSKSLNGEAQQVLSLEEDLFIISNKGFYYYSNSKLSTVREFKNEVTVTQVIQLPRSLLLLTDQGNFHFSQQLKRLIPLGNWLKTSTEAANKFHFGSFEGQKLNLISDDLKEWLEIVLNENSGIYSVRRISKEFELQTGEYITNSAQRKDKSGMVFITNKNELILLQDNVLRRIVQNYDKSLGKIHKIIIDINGDIWMASTNYGLFKVSLEPFTRVLLHPEYNSPDVFFLFRTKSGDIFMSKRENITQIGNIFNGTDFVNYNFLTLSATETNDDLILGTSEGVKVFNKRTKQIKDFTIPGLAKERVSYIGLFNEDLFVALSGKGLRRYRLSDRTEQPIEGIEMPEYVYTAQENPMEKRIYFGTNNGIYFFDIKAQKLIHLKESTKNGSYVGVSIKDAYGNLWFTGDNGLFGITKNGEFRSYTDDKYFNSRLFYTLNSDNLGNLILGTNKGLNILELDEMGNIIRQSFYTGQKGFGGYETNMRAQFQDANSIFVGTIEGVFLINTDILRRFPKPTPPVIKTLVEEMIDSEGNSFAFQFSTNNPKIQHLFYSYRIKGYQNEWSELSETEKILIGNLPNGTYSLEVRSSYDGMVFSDVSSMTFKVDNPFWKSRWFLIGLILLVAGVNILIILRRKTFEGGNLFKTKDMLVELTMAPTILLFSFIAVIISSYIAPLVDSRIPNTFGATVITGFLLLALFLFSKSEEARNRTQTFRLLLVIGYLIVMCHFLFGAVVSKIHPFYVVALALSMTLLPFIFEQLKHVIIHALILLVISVVILLYIGETNYDKFLFLLMILISSSLSIFSSYLRYDSLERLIFISGVINKGNVQVISFTGDGTITYVSENIKDIIPIGHHELIKQRISDLNKFLPDEPEYKNVDLTKEFYDGQKYLVPMLNDKGDIHWIEWSCKVFSEKVKVILGQDVSDRMELENTYEVLVENAQDLIYQTDANGVLTFVNRHFTQILDYSVNELEGKNFSLVVHPDYLEQVVQFYKEHFDKQLKSTYFEFPLISRNGRVIWIGQHVTARFSEGKKGKISGFIALARDITLKREQEQIIREQRDDITSSIRYAQRIQINLQPDQRDFEHSFQDSFVIYRPKDIVSGDFYWTHRLENRTVIALGDCTGHGVPGAFMTLLGINLLDSIVIENRITEASDILNQMDERLINALRIQDSNEQINDGMELTVLVYDHLSGILDYACAGSRFLIFEGNSFNMFKGDVKHIGDDTIDGFKEYISHSLVLQPDSTVYLLTDGFQDQFGGDREKKFSFRRVLETFEENIRLPLSEQKIMIEEEFDRWRQDIEQTDDVTVIALRNPKK